MKRRVEISKHFGSFCGSGDDVVRNSLFDVPSGHRQTEVFVIDFKGVKSISSSFATGLVQRIQLMETRGSVGRVVFQNCNPSIKTLLEIAFVVSADQRKSSRSN